MAHHSFSAVIFDLDGVITQTALVHSRAWKEMFDGYLRFREKKYGEAFREFTHAGDYLPYVDGKPRYQGVASFLESRKIDIPFGDPADDPDAETVCGLGNRKNDMFNRILERDGVKLYDSTVELIRELNKAGIHTGVASSSKNCKAVLEAARLPDLFETRVDGTVSAELGLKGKPEPDIFTTACDNLGVDYDLSVVVEDAVSGVQAGRKGNFGLVLGIAREDNARELLINGADIVVEDMSELGGIAGIDSWFQKGLDEDCWSICYHDYDSGKERSRETLLTVGNGYFGTRGAMEEAGQCKINYPGTYMAGVYNRRVSRVAGRDIENEDLVNVPDWRSVNFRIDDGEYMDPNNTGILSITRRLSFRDGLLSREMVVEDDKRRQTRITSKRIGSMDDPHLAALQYQVTPVNYSGRITLRSSLSGDHVNDGVERYRQLDQQHLEVLDQGGDKHMQFLLVRTNQSETEIAMAARIRVFLNQAEREPGLFHLSGPGRIDSETELGIRQGQTVTLEKSVGIFTSRETGSGLALKAARESAAQSAGFHRIRSGSEEKWEEIWKKADIRLEGDRYAQKLLRMHIYHLMVTASPHNAVLDAAIPARGLHGEAYRGHIFWDELYVMAFYALHFPDIARSALMYRYRRLDMAREYARESGYRGAMFPWQSGSDGREETQVVHLNPVSGEWGDDYSSLQRHVSLAIAYNIWHYYWISMDEEFMLNEGGEMILEICRFWSSMAIPDTKTGRYSIERVMGPDEFHEQLPGTGKGGLKDNAYTNLMVAWLFGKVIAFLESVPEEKSASLGNRISLKGDEIERWKDIAGKLKLVVSADGILSQFEGYFGLKELDWDHYRGKYGDINRMDRILKAEGESPDDFKVSKQADALMIFYNLEQEEVGTLLENMGYGTGSITMEKNFDYYIERTSHGSTLSRIVHASLASRLSRPDVAWKLYMEALSSDYVDIQGGTTGEGIHAGVMGSTLLYVIRSVAGIRFNSDTLRIDPRLPERWKKIGFGFAFRKKYYTFEIFSEKISISVDSSDDQPVEFVLSGKVYRLKPGEKVEVGY